MPTHTVMEFPKKDQRALSAFARLQFFELAERYGRRTTIALLENRPAEACAFFARMSAHFAIQAMSGREGA